MTDRENLAREVAERLGLKLEGHIPGPWHWYGNKGLEAMRETVMYADCGRPSCGRTRMSLSEADANLIAAAPTLWDALLDSEEKCRKLQQELSVYKASPHGICADRVPTPPL